MSDTKEQGSGKLDRRSLSEQLADLLKCRIGGRSRGLRLPIDKELAGEMGVSVPTLRKALGLLASEGWVEQAEGSGWRVANRVMDRRVAVLCDADSFIARAQECRRQLERAGYAVSMYLGDVQPGETPPERLTCKQFLEDLEMRGFAGVIAPWAYPHKEWTERLKQLGIPLVGFGVLHENSVSYDMAAYIKPALQLLKRRGIRRVAYLGAVSSWKEQGYDDQFLQKVREWIQEAGLECRDGWVRQDWHRAVSGSVWSSFRELWTADVVRPEAVILGTSMLWTGFEQAIRSMNIRIPQDLQVVFSHDSRDVAKWRHLPATRVVSDSELHVRAGVEMLIDLMEGRLVENHRVEVDSWSIEEPKEDKVDVDENSLNSGIPSLFGIL